MSKFITTKQGQKAFQKKIIDNLVYKVFVGDGDFLVALNFLDISKTETISLDDINETMAQLKGILAVLCVRTLHAKLHQQK